MTDPVPGDSAARATALDTTASFIVQAPAGSGKTGLLTQRLLALLAQAAEPEEILAITFTRKAAAEMRHRVLDALAAARRSAPDDAYAHRTWELARSALARDAARGWQLTRNPNRLRIQTFDSLNHALARQLPLTGALGAAPGVLDDASPHYRSAAVNTLDQLEEPGIGDDLAIVLRHLDNRRALLEALLAAMLARRDQWLALSLEPPDGTSTVDALGRAIGDQLAGVVAASDPVWLADLQALAAQAGQALRDGGQPGHPLAALAGPVRRWPVDWAGLPRWKALATLLLTEQRQPRRRWDKRSGFPSATETGIDAADRERRRAAKAAIADIAGQLTEDQALLNAWSWVPLLPTEPPDATRQQVLDATLRVLVRAAAELQLVFAEAGEVDFTEIQLRALQALGHPEQPSDLALRLDYRLQHLLVDEFQDTSSTQFRMLEQLTAGWTPEDGRTLFAVGDPMQSIYRFREAEVGLYLQAWQSGLANVTLRRLKLTVNFRSEAGIVDWINRQFPQVLPPASDPLRGAVAYTAAQANDARRDSAAVQLHITRGQDLQEEADTVVGLVRAALAGTPDRQVAVLARARSHLAAIAQALTRAGLRFRAVDIDPLAERPVVRDLRALTRALLHPADRLSWLTVLHAPWIGLPLETLLRIAEGRSGSLPLLLRDADRLAGLDANARARIHRLLVVLDEAGPARGRRSLRQWVEGIWLRLGGLAAAGAAANDDAQAFLALLDRHAVAGGLVDFARLDEAIERLYAAPDNRADGRLQLMTMHKAKGLEFDTVILPGLGRRARPDAGELLYWLERPAAGGVTELLMAPIRRADESREPISDYLRAVDKDKTELETARLLYVAATRARHRLHLVGHVAPGLAGSPAKPASGSLLKMLWPAIGDQVGTLPDTAAPTGSAEEPRPLETLRRLAADWQPADLADLDRPPADDGRATEETAIEFSWAGNTARHVGTVVHRQLERIAGDGIANWPGERAATLERPVRLALAQLGVTTDQLDTAVDKALRAIRNTLKDERGRWVLADHAEARSEWALTLNGERPSHLVIDRTFIDGGIRWIIDYKTGDHHGADLERFLDDEQARYRDQLETYAQLLGHLDSRPIHLALYFPLFPGWRQWVFRG